jgi:hypothetical protein
VYLGRDSLLANLRGETSITNLLRVVGEDS